MDRIIEVVVAGIPVVSLLVAIVLFQVSEHSNKTNW